MNSTLLHITSASNQQGALQFKDASHLFIDAMDLAYDTYRTTVAWVSLEWDAMRHAEMHRFHVEVIYKLVAWRQVSLMRLAVGKKIA